MLPPTPDNGARLAAILPMGLAGLAAAHGGDPVETLERATGRPLANISTGMTDRVVPMQSFVMVVVDGLGHANLRERAAYARTLSRLQQRRIETVIPSTTGAALTTLTTGRLPGEHGLLGYRILHPTAGLVSTLKDWDAVDDPRSWQRSEPLFGLAASLGVRPLVLGRPAHRTGGLTEAILRGADYVAGQRIDDRFAELSRILRGGERVCAYLYVDELDRAAHRYGAGSDEWARALESLDAGLDALLRSLPGGTGLVVTADHGIVDVPSHAHVMLDDVPEALDHVVAVGGEPRFRSLYLRDGSDAAAIAARIGASEGHRAVVATREQAAAAGWFGPVDASGLARLGDVLIAARKRVAYYSSHDDPKSLAMVGQHGGLSEEERGVPLAVAGALDGTGFVSAVAAVAQTA
ncbi:alkaline phosphatase family protein [Leucobacter tardus]|uniref:Alkaline phosphatase family protein n=1 Tax=Leucobacter tardus TaxID=501483 RepID=A0A939TNC8_9MICO|nr:alkaline phosphatase family protein [Leucobacter tardus]MBO2990074.1 alkaline phosphatase family protein [Leucobacter tardus]